MTGPDRLLEIHIQQAPVALWARSQQHSEELLREFTLISTGQRTEGTHEIPHRLTRLVDELTMQYAGMSEEQEQQLAEAIAAGKETVDLVYRLPAAVAAHVRHLGDLLGEADDYCRRGEHLLTLATPADQIAFRRWFLAEIERQVEGQSPQPWPDYAAAHDVS